MGNSNYGWWAGGSPAGATGQSTVDRIDFANDSLTATARGLISRSRSFTAGNSNSSYGWVAGGVGPISPPTYLSLVDRIDFANDSPTSASRRGPLSVVRAIHGSSGNASYGWFAGGASPGTISSIDRIDYSNDSPTSANPRGPLSQVRTNMAGTGNTNYGWFGGGGTSSATNSIVERIDYSNDLATASVRNSLSAARYQLGATGNTNYGWFGGGGGTSIIDRVDYANDTNANALARNILSTSAGRGVGSVSNYVK
jgi:hypothetical protein